MLLTQREIMRIEGCIKDVRIEGKCHIHHSFGRDVTQPFRELARGTRLRQVSAPSRIFHAFTHNHCHPPHQTHIILLRALGGWAQEAEQWAE